jgi:hypothetical protein
MVPPVLVTVEPARTPKVLAEPSGTGACAAVASWHGNITPSVRIMIHRQRLNFLFLFTDSLVLIVVSLFFLFIDVVVIFLSFVVFILLTDMPPQGAILSLTHWRAC